MPHGGRKLDTAGMLTARDLRGRGWTAAVIGRFLAKPDVTETNPHYALSRAWCMDQGCRCIDPNPVWG